MRDLSHQLGRAAVVERRASYFDELVELPPGPPDPDRIAGIAARYGLELDFASIPTLVEEHGVRFGAA